MASTTFNLTASLTCLHALPIGDLVLYLPHSYFVTDHKQAWREDDNVSVVPGEAAITSSLPTSGETAWAIEEHKRWQMRKQMFPQLRDDTVIFANWNQLYKVGPGFPFLSRVKDER